MIKNTLFLIFICISINSIAQNINRTYQGWWYETNWMHEFKPNGKYKLTTEGHFGNTTKKGKYIQKGDSLILETSWHSGKMEYEYFLMYGDSIIIDLFLRYDYKRPLNSGSFHNSNLREVKYPQIETNNHQAKNILDSILNVVFNTPELKAYYHFDEEPEREFIIADYYVLKPKILVDSLEAISKPKSEIKEGDFYIEIIDINMNPEQINIELSIKKEGIEVWFDFKKENEKWIYQNPRIIER